MKVTLPAAMDYRRRVRQNMTLPSRGGLKLKATEKVLVDQPGPESTANVNMQYGKGQVANLVIQQIKNTQLLVLVIKQQWQSSSSEIQSLLLVLQYRDAFPDISLQLYRVVFGKSSDDVVEKITSGLKKVLS